MAVEIHVVKQMINYNKTRKPASGESGQRKSAPIDFGDKNKKPEKTNWDSAFKEFDEGDIKFLCGPERKKRSNRLVSK